MNYPLVADFDLPRFLTFALTDSLLAGARLSEGAPKPHGVRASTSCPSLVTSWKRGRGAPTRDSEEATRGDGPLLTALEGIRDRRAVRHAPNNSWCSGHVESEAPIRGCMAASIRRPRRIGNTFRRASRRGLAGSISSIASSIRLASCRGCARGGKGSRSGPADAAHRLADRRHRAKRAEAAPRCLRSDMPARWRPRKRDTGNGTS
jgi:hypothetical protein